MHCKYSEHDEPSVVYFRHNGLWRYRESGTFHAQDLSFPRTNSPYGELSFWRVFVPGNFCSREHSFLGTFFTWTIRSRELSGPFVQRNFRSKDFSFPGIFVPPTILQSINCEPQTTVTNVRIFCRRPSTVCFPKIN